MPVLTISIIGFLVAFLATSVTVFVSAIAAGFEHYDAAQFLVFVAITESGVMMYFGSITIGLFMICLGYTLLLIMYQWTLFFIAQSDEPVRRYVLYTPGPIGPEDDPKFMEGIK